MSPAEVTPADVDRVRAILEAGEAQTRYPVDWAAWWDRVRLAIETSLPLLGGSRWTVALAGLVGLAAVAGVLLLVVLRRSRARRPAAPRARPLPPSPPAAAGRWVGALAAGDAPAALAALWDWLAEQLLQRGLAPATPDRTAREVVALADPAWPGRQELAGLAAELDRWTFGGRAVGMDRVLELGRRAAALVGQPLPEAGPASGGAVP